MHTRLTSGRSSPSRKQVDSDKDIKLGCSQAAQDLNPLDRIDVSVNVANSQSDVAEVVGEILGRPLRECCDEDALVFLNALLAKLDRFINLALERAQSQGRIEQSGRANDLFNDEVRTFFRGVEILDGLLASRNAG